MGFSMGLPYISLLQQWAFVLESSASGSTQGVSGGKDSTVGDDIRSNYE